MNNTPNANRFHIVIFGRVNVGKSSLINALAGQEVSIVSKLAGTTTDPIQKAMEILPLGPVVLIDTAGIDDQSELGLLRVQRSFDMLEKADMVLLVLNDSLSISKYELTVIAESKRANKKVVAVANKSDKIYYSQELLKRVSEQLDEVDIVVTNTINNEGIDVLKETIIKNAPSFWDDAPIIGDLLAPKDTVVLVTPIDAAAPKGRIILPQVQVIRDILDHDCSVVVAKDSELVSVLENLKQKPRMVVADSQVFKYVDSVVDSDIELTSFSILFARYKGDLTTLVQGAAAIKNLKAGDKVLIAEACTHHKMQDDIGTVKIPKWLNEYVGGKLDFKWVAGNDFVDDLQDYKLIVHCGSCMLNKQAMLSRLMKAQAQGVPIVNYGIAIAYVHGILKRVLSPFPDVKKILD